MKIASPLVYNKNYKLTITSLFIIVYKISYKLLPRSYMPINYHLQNYTHTEKQVLKINYIATVYVHDFVKEI